MYPDQSLYSGRQRSGRRSQDSTRPCLRADLQIEQAKTRPSTIWFLPILADAEAGFRCRLKTPSSFMKAMIEAGAPGPLPKTSSHPKRSGGTMGGK